MPRLFTYPQVFLHSPSFQYTLFSLTLSPRLSTITPKSRGGIQRYHNLPKRARLLAANGSTPYAGVEPHLLSPSFHQPRARIWHTRSCHTHSTPFSAHHPAHHLSPARGVHHPSPHPSRHTRHLNSTSKESPRISSRHHRVPQSV